VFFNCFLTAHAQDLTLACLGQTEMNSTIGGDKYSESNSYEFKNGKMYGHLITEWTENSITINLQKQFNSDGNYIYERNITFDRVLGTVLDQTKMWRSDIEKNGIKPNVILTFKGECKKGSLKF
jgi:hypothetical protein